MRPSRWMMLLPVCLAAVLATGAARAADDKAPAGALDRKALDGLIYTNLKDVINHGAYLYNNGDWNACYRLYEGSLMTLKPLLAHRPALQKAITDGIAGAEQDPQLFHRAFVLRAVIDQIRSEVNPHPKAKDKGKEPPVAKAKNLWERLGGERGVTRIVDDFANLVTRDKKVDFFRGNKYKPKPEEIVKMKRDLVEQISEATGGPLKYTGPNMKEVHRGMGITNAQYDAMLNDLVAAMEKNDVLPADIATIKAAVNSYRKEIVQPKKPVDKKPEDKKPTDKKPEDKKPIDKKPVDKKPIDKKPVDKKPAPGASISGKVTFNGKPLPAGTITFLAGEKSYSTVIDAEGSYQVSGLKPGEYRVTISTEKLKAPAPGGKLPPGAKPPEAKPAPKFVPIPEKYRDAKTTPLLVKVVEGQQVLDFELK